MFKFEAKHDKPLLRVIAISFSLAHSSSKSWIFLFVFYQYIHDNNILKKLLVF